MIEIPEATLINTDKLKVDGDNPNKMTPKQLERLKSSVTKYGFIVPIITNKDLLVADGEQRLTTARALNMKQVPVIRLPIEDVDRRLLRQVLNKLRGEHELLADAYEFERIIKAGHEDDLKQLLDLSDSHLERYLAEIREHKDEDYEVPEIDKIETDIKRGDVFQLHMHRLMCGDATQEDDVKALMNGKKANLGLHDPPYGTKLFAGKPTRFYSGSHSTGHKPSQIYAPIIGDENQIDPKPLLELCTTTLLFGANYFADKLPLSPAWIVWDKQTNSIRNFGDAELIWTNQKDTIRLITHTWHGFRKGNETGQKRLHPAQKPIKLLSELIEEYSEKNQTILDLFGGSGSTLIACEQTGRHCYMMEIDPRYCQIIINRWQQYTGKKAVKIGEVE